MTIIQFPVHDLRLLKAKKSNSPPQKTSRNSRTYLEVRHRPYLFEEKVEAMVKAARKGRWGHRDSTLILMGLQARAADIGAGEFALAANQFQYGSHPRQTAQRFTSSAFTRCQARKCWRWGSCKGIFLIHPTYLSRRGVAR
jgi:hypothetical protein